jgi:hypothetical protein
MQLASEEARQHMAQHTAFKKVGATMLEEWRKGLALSTQT